MQHNFKLTISFCLVIFFTTLKSYAQQIQKDSNTIIHNACMECDSYIARHKMDKAIECYEKLTQQYATNYKLYLRLAQLHFREKKYALGIFYAQQSMQFNANESFASLFSICNSLFENKESSWGFQLSSSIQKNSYNPTNIQKLKTLEQKYILSNQTNYVSNSQLFNLGDSINTTENEYLPSLSLDEKTMVFTRNVGGNEDFFITRKNKQNTWQKAVNMGYPPNTNLPDGGAKLSTDGHYLFYTRCDMRSPNGYEGGGCDIVFSYEEDSTWSAPQYFGLTINTPAYEGQPCLSSDNSAMYFVSDRAGGHGGKDIWVSYFKNNFWTEPKNLGASINTANDEISPFIHTDNETLYFSSNGHVGLGLHDLFVSKKINDTTWSPATNLGVPINSKGFEGSIVVNATGSLAYCVSDRNDSKGGLDIYSFELPQAFKPIATACLKGYVVDKFTKEKLNNVKITCTSLQKNELTESNKGDASYTLSLHQQKDYLLSVHHKNYRPFYKYFHLDNDSNSSIFLYDIKLKEPLLVDTLLKTTLQLDSSQTKLDSLSTEKINTIFSKWKTWNEDSAVVKIFLKAYYYVGDSLADSSFTARVEKCANQLHVIESYFKKRKISCDIIMQEMNMLALKDEEEWFNMVDVEVREDY